MPARRDLSARIACHGLRGLGAEATLGGSQSPQDGSGAISGVGEPLPDTGAAQSAFCVVLPYPPSLNHLWRRVGAKTLLSAEGRAYHERVAMHVAVAKTTQATPSPPHAITLSISLPDRRRRDIDNVFKALLDPLYKALGLDDSVIVDLHAVKRYGASRVGVVVRITTAQALGRGPGEPGEGSDGGQAR